MRTGCLKMDRREDQDARGFFLGLMPVAETNASDFQGLFVQWDKGHTGLGSNLGFQFTPHSPKSTCGGVLCKHCVPCFLRPIHSNCSALRNHQGTFWGLSLETFWTSSPLVAP